MKHIIATFATSAVLGSLATAGDFLKSLPQNGPEGFESARRPITNPTLFDLAIPTTNIHPIYVHHNLPDSINTKGGTTTNLGGDLDVYALQFEVAMSDRLSIVATKDGYIRIDDNTLNGAGYDSGFANLGGGLKYAFHLDPEAGTALSATATLELPTGDDDVFQGEGDGAMNLILNGLKLHDKWQFAGSVGTQIPFSNDQSTNLFVSTHASYEVHKWFIPLVELSWFHVVNAGDSGNLFPGVSDQITFEGSDFFNTGANNAESNRDLVTAAVGFRSRLTETMTAGAAYEVPLTSDEKSLWEDRLTLDVIWTF